MLCEMQVYRYSKHELEDSFKHVIKCTCKKIKITEVVSNTYATMSSKQVAFNRTKHKNENYLFTAILAPANPTSS